MFGDEEKRATHPVCYSAIKVGRQGGKRVLSMKRISQEQGRAADFLWDQEQLFHIVYNEETNVNRFDS